MIRTWNISPPEPKPNIVHIALVDMDMFVATVIPANPLIRNLRVLGGDVQLERAGDGLMSISQDTPYLVTFSNGQVARCSYATLRHALDVLGQTWEEGS